jgi:hypothetical protein
VNLIDSRGLIDREEDGKNGRQVGSGQARTSMQIASAFSPLAMFVSVQYFVALMTFPSSSVN